MLLGVVHARKLPWRDGRRLGLKLAISHVLDGLSGAFRVAMLGLAELFVAI